MFIYVRIAFDTQLLCFVPTPASFWIFPTDISAGESGTSDLIYRPTEGGEVFSQLVSLCTEPAILGDKLLHALAAMADDPSEPSQSGGL